MLLIKLNDLHFDVQAPMVSYDHHDNDSDPSTYDHEHGTSVSGIVGAAKNSTCGVGIAYECNLGSKCDVNFCILVSMFDQSVTDNCTCFRC